MEGYRGLKEDLKESHSQSVQMLEAAGFQWVNQGRDGKPWPGYFFVKRDGTVVKFSYQEIADHSVHWIRDTTCRRGILKAEVSPEGPPSRAPFHEAAPSEHYLSAACAAEWHADDLRPGAVGRRGLCLPPSAPV
jgi:hypothetical protein